MIPIAPDGAALESYVNALNYLNGIKRYLFKRTCIVWRARKVSREMLGDTMSALQVLMKFTALPLVLETMHEATKREIFERISSGNADAEVTDLLMRLLPKSGPKYKRCPCCIDEDLYDYGFSFGRTLHQFAGIYTCPNHGVLLEDGCPACGARFEFLPRIAPYRGELQVYCRCKTRSGRPLPSACSHGYEAFVKLLARGLEGRAAEVRPLQLKAALDRFAELSENGLNVLSVFAKFWDSEDLRDACKVSGASSKEVWRALIFGVPPVCVISIYVLASFFSEWLANDIPYVAP